jgi:hypothetical protein
MCFVQTKDFRLKDAMGATIGVPPQYSPFVAGSVFALDFSIWTDTCLQSGEIGWLLDIEGDPSGSDLFDPLAAIEFQYDETEASSLSAARIIPDGYLVSATASATVCFTNVGTGPAALTAQTFSKFVILDDTGAPLDWDFLTGHIEPLGLLAPGSAGSVSMDRGILFQGTAHRMRAFIDFQSPGPSAEPSAPEGIGPASAEYRPMRNELRAASAAVRNAQLASDLSRWLHLASRSFPR